MIISLSYVVLTGDEVFQLLSHMFDNSSVIVRPDSMPAPFCSENPPHVVRVFIFFDNIFFYY
jgi:hypothetical protein